MGLFDDVPAVTEDAVPAGQSAAGYAVFADVPPVSGQLKPEPLIPSPVPGQGRFWPVRHTPQGTQFDYSAGALGSLLRTITSPYDLVRGAIDPGSPEAYQRAADSAWNISPISPSYRAGARFGTVSPLGEPTINPLASGDQALFGGMRGNLTKAPLTPPSAADLQASGRSGYRAIEQSGLEVPSSFLSNLASDIKDQFGVSFSPTSADRTFAQLDLMSNPKRSATPLATLVEHRQALTNIINTSKDADRAAAIQARNILDQQIDNLGRGNTQVSGYGPPTMAPEAVGPTLQQARGDTRAAMSASEISGELSPATTGFIEKAEGRTQPMSEQLSKRARAILESDKDIKGFLPDEREALKTIRDGTATSATLKWFGDKFGNIDWRSALSAGSVGGLLGTASGGGSQSAGMIGTGLLAGGVLAKAIANAMAKGQTRVAEELVRSNSPLARSLVENQTLSYSPGTARDAAIMRLLGPGLLDAPLPTSRPGYI